MRFSLSFKTKLETVLIYVSNNSTDMICARNVEEQTTCNPSFIVWIRKYERESQKVCVSIFCLYMFSSSVHASCMQPDGDFLAVKIYVGLLDYNIV